MDCLRSANAVSYHIIIFTIFSAFTIHMSATRETLPITRDICLPSFQNLWVFNAVLIMPHIIHTTHRTTLITYHLLFHTPYFEMLGVERSI